MALCALILSETLALYKSFTYLLTYLLTLGLPVDRQLRIQVVTELGVEQLQMGWVNFLTPHQHKVHFGHSLRMDSISSGIWLYVGLLWWPVLDRSCKVSRNICLIISWIQWWYETQFVFACIRHRHVSIPSCTARSPEVARSDALTGSAVLTCDRFPVCGVLGILEGHAHARSAANHHPVIHFQLWNGAALHQGWLEFPCDGVSWFTYISINHQRRLHGFSLWVFLHAAANFRQCAKTF